MPSALTYPGVYIEEVPSGVRTITGVATSITAFIGRARRGPVDVPIRVQSFAELNRVFGGLWQSSTLSYAVQPVLPARRHRCADRARAQCRDHRNRRGGYPEPERRKSRGCGGNSAVRVDHGTRPEVGDERLFNLTVRDIGTGATETFRNVSVLTEHPRAIGRVLAEESRLVRLSGAAPSARPAATRMPHRASIP